MNTLELKTQLDKTRLAHRQEETRQECVLIGILVEEYSLDEYFKTVQSSIENSNEYGSEEYGIIQWARVTLPNVPKELMPYVVIYARDHYTIELDVNNSAASIYVGPSILIDQDSGNIHDEETNKSIGNMSEFNSNAALKTFINEYMDNAGHYPSVFRIDRHGNVVLINTLQG